MRPPCNFVLATLLLMAWEFEDEGIDPALNLAKWLVNDLDCKRRNEDGVPSVWG